MSPARRRVRRLPCTQRTPASSRTTRPGSPSSRRHSMPIARKRYSESTSFRDDLPFSAARVGRRHGVTADCHSFLQRRPATIRTLHLPARALAGSLLALALAGAAHAQKAKEPWEYLKEPAFKSAYAKALGPKAGTPWLAKRDGPAPDSMQTVAGSRRRTDSERQIGRRSQSANRSDDDERRAAESGLGDIALNPSERRCEMRGRRERAVLDHRGRRVGRHAASAESRDDVGERRYTHVDHKSQAAPRQDRPVGRDALLRVAGDERDPARDAAVSHGNADRGGHRGSGGDAAHDLGLDAGRAKGEHFFSASPEHERVPALDSRDDEAAPREPNHQPLDEGLRRRPASAALAD